jgi:hypothetical protein
LIMFFEKNKPIIRDDLKYSIPSRFHQKKILSFLRYCLPEWAKICGDNSVFSTMNEDSISGEIADFLNDQLRNSSGYLFRFEAKKGPDFLVFASPYQMLSEELFVIEAKRLPPTNSQDYVKIGIGRFKNEEHGQNHNIAAMLGYIQKNDFNHWFDQVNSWITTLISLKNETPEWTPKDKICVIQISDIGEYKSEHSRITKNPITIHHFWLNLCSNN